MKGKGGSGLILANGPVSPITADDARKAGVTVADNVPKGDVELMLEALGILNLLRGEEDDQIS